MSLKIDTGAEKKPQGQAGYPAERTFFASMGIEYAAQGPEAGDEEGPAGNMEVPLGVGTEEHVVAWTQRLRKEAEFFPPNEVIECVWITCIPAVDGRVPWERGEKLSLHILVLEGELPVYVLEEYDEDVEVRKLIGGALH